MNSKSLITTGEARKLLGTLSKELTDEQVLKLVQKVEQTTDAIIDYMIGSNIKRDNLEI